MKFKEMLKLENSIIFWGYENELDDFIELTDGKLNTDEYMQVLAYVVYKIHNKLGRGKHDDVKLAFNVAYANVGGTR